MTKDDYKAKIREAIIVGYTAGNLEGIKMYKDWLLFNKEPDIANKIDKLVDKFLEQKDES